MTEIACPRCRVTGTVPNPGLTRWQCRTCGHSYFLRRCAACRRVSYVSGLQGYNQSWACTWCAQPNAGFRQRRDRAAATAGELAAELDRFAGTAPALDGGPGVAGAPDLGREFPGQPVAPGAKVAGPGAGPASWRSRRTLTIAVALLVVVVAGAAIGASVGGSTLAGAPAAGPSAAPDGPVGTAAGTGPGGTRPGSSSPAEVRQTSRTVAVTGTGAVTVDLDGVGGQLTVTAGPGPARLTGTLSWTGHPPRISVRRDQAGRVLHLSYRCAAASPCTEDYRLTVPADVALSVRQPSGQVTLSGLSGPLAITAASADVVARHLRAASLRAAITAGRFDASFDSPPQSVRVVLNKAEGTVRVPGTVRYRVRQRVSAGSVDVGVPRSGSSGRVIAATVSGGQLALLDS